MEAPLSEKPVPLVDEEREILLQQYRLLEERRMYFGRQFMQTVAFVGGVLAVLVGLLGQQNEVLLRWVLGIGGVASLLMAVLASRLGQRQDDCENGMRRIEARLHDAGFQSVVTFQPGAGPLGARNLIVSALVLLGLGACAQSETDSPTVPDATLVAALGPDGPEFLGTVIGPRGTFAARSSTCSARTGASSSGTRRASSPSRARTPTPRTSGGTRWA